MDVPVLEMTASPWHRGAALSSSATIPFFILFYNFFEGEADIMIMVFVMLLLISDVIGGCQYFINFILFVYLYFIKLVFTVLLT